MIGTHSVLAIVPARAHSSRIPHKNTRPLAGKPLISYTFDSAKGSSYLDRIVLASDDAAAGEIAKREGIEWPFVRPDEVSGDLSPDIEVFRYTLNWLQEHEGYSPDIVVHLRPTSPLRTSKHIDQAIELLAAHPEVDSVRTVTEPEQSPYKMYALDEEGFLKPLLRIQDMPDAYNMPQQSLPTAYKHVGYADVAWRRTIIEKDSMTGEHILPLILTGAESGINVESDWARYEYLIKRA